MPTGTCAVWDTVRGGERFETSCDGPRGAEAPARAQACRRAPRRRQPCWRSPQIGRVGREARSGEAGTYDGECSPERPLVPRGGRAMRESRFPRPGARTRNGNKISRVTACAGAAGPSRLSTNAERRSCVIASAV